MKKRWSTAVISATLLATGSVVAAPTQAAEIDTKSTPGMCDVNYTFEEAESLFLQAPAVVFDALQVAMRQDIISEAGKNDLADYDGTTFDPYEEPATPEIAFAEARTAGYAESELDLLVRGTDQGNWSTEIEIDFFLQEASDSHDLSADTDWQSVRFKGLKLLSGATTPSPAMKKAISRIDPEIIEKATAYDKALTVADDATREACLAGKNIKVDYPSWDPAGGDQQVSGWAAFFKPLLDFFSAILGLFGVSSSGVSGSSSSLSGSSL